MDGGIDLPISGDPEDFADCEIDLSRSDAPEDIVFEPWSCRVPVASDRKTWSSLAAVLFLHAALACILWVSPKPHPGSYKSIEVQLVSMQGFAQKTGPGPQERLEAGGGEQSATVAAPANKELLNSRLTTEHDRVLPAERKSHTQANQRPKRTEMALTNPKEQKEIKSPQHLNLAQTEVGANQSEGSSQAAGAGTGAAGDVSNQGGEGGKNEPGGFGLVERSLGSPDGPSFLRKVLPVYPALARKLEKEGNVLLCVTIDERGRPVEIEVLRKAGFGFDEEAVKAVQGSTFVPAKKEGKPLACKVLLPIRFVLKQS